MKSLAIFGAGGMGKEILTIVNFINRPTCKWNILGFYEDDENEKIPGNYPRLGGLDELNQCEHKLYLVLGMSSPKVKVRIQSLIRNPNIKYPSLIHPTVLNDSCDIGKGVVVGPYSVLNSESVIADFVFLGSLCTIGHDVKIGEFCSVMPGSNISGNVDIHEQTFIGTGAQILQGLTIGTNCTIGAGSLVNKDVPENHTVVGVPARPINK